MGAQENLSYCFLEDCHRSKSSQEHPDERTLKTLIFSNLKKKKSDVLEQPNCSKWSVY